MLSGKFAVITGAGAGIGAATARIFAREHAAGIAVVDIREEQAEKVAEELRGMGTQAIAVSCNVADAESVRAAAARVTEAFGRIDILVNNAGITRDVMFHKMTDAQWHAVIDVNLGGMYNWCRAVIGGMRDRGYGRIVNLSSGSVRGIPGQTNYAATKAAMIGFTNTLAKESARKGITVNCVAPGATDTEMYAQVPDHVLQAMLESNPTHRLGRPEEIGEVIAFLASERASYVNGQWFLVNGGK